MADTKDNETTDAPIRTRGDARRGLAARIRKQGAPPAGIPMPKKILGDAGIYEVAHGRVCLGHENGETVYAESGAHVELTAEEAGRMLAEGTVKKVA